MSKDTPSMARNKVRRCLAAIIDPHPSKAEKLLLWEHFLYQCVYCGTPLCPKDRNGHLDHVLASAAGGGNSIFNHVLSCARCNGDEKREESWAPFLSRKAQSSDVAAVRRLRIEAWLARAPAISTSLARAEEADTIITDALTSFDRAVEKMRALRRSGI